MQGADSVKSILLQNLDLRIAQVEKCGCPIGKVHDEKLVGVNKDMDKVLKSLDELKATTGQIIEKLFWGLLVLVIIAFMAGINITNSFLDKVIK